METVYCPNPPDKHKVMVSNYAYPLETNKDTEVGEIC